MWLDGGPGGNEAWLDQAVPLKLAAVLAAAAWDSAASARVVAAAASAWAAAAVCCLGFRSSFLRGRIGRHGIKVAGGLHEAEEGHDGLEARREGADVT